MHPLLQSLVAIVLLLATFFPTPAPANAPITILCDSGRTGFIDNSLIATSVAIDKGADYLELPLQLSADNQLMVYHSPALQANTNAAQLFPMRSRKDGNYYFVDFTIPELQQIRQVQATSANKPPLLLPIASLAETLGLLARFNENRTQQTGVVLHIMYPSFYIGEGKDVGRITVQTLLDAGYSASDKLFIESYDPDELQKIARFSDSLGQKRFSLIQRVESERADTEAAKIPGIARQDNSWFFTNSGLRILASYATALALPTEILQGNAFTAMDISAFIHGLRQYNVKIFAVTENGESIQLSALQAAEEEPGKTTQPLAVETGNSIDGRYVSSFRKIMDERQMPSTRTDTLETAAPNNSTLPPFFSNLGLKQPNNAPTADEDEPVQKRSTEEAEAPAETPSFSWE